MNLRTFVSAFLFIQSFVLFQTATHCFADEYMVGIAQESFDAAYVEQKQSQWCWAAGIQSILKFYGVDLAQEELVRRFFGIGSFELLPNIPGSLSSISQNLNQWGLDSNGKRFFVTSQMGLGAPAPSFLVDELSQQHPLLVAYKTLMGDGHVVVATAAVFDGVPERPLIRRLVVRDPSPGARMNQGTIEYSGHDLASKIDAYWIIRVLFSEPITK